MAPRATRLRTLVRQAKACQICAPSLGHEPRPVFSAHPEAKLLLVGQAPGAKVHASGVPWADASGKRLRSWLGLDDETFYDETQVAILPMGFCFPGTGKSGDLPPRPECAPKWMQPLVDQMPKLQLTLLIGMYAQRWFLKESAKATLTKTVEAWQDYTAHGYFVLPHPSPRNGIWLRRNPFFEAELVPLLQSKVADALGH
ncbi:MAG: uracil-DNA glycosylase family protein [Nannocystales bacterium]